MANPIVFFSYSRKDADLFALKLASELRAAGAPVWIDQLDIQPGRNWDKEIEKALKAAQYVLFIASIESVNSDNVLNEIDYAVDAKKVIIPIKIHPCDIPLRIRRLQYIDFTRNYDAGFSRLLQNLELNTNIELEELGQSTYPNESENVMEGPKSEDEKTHKNQKFTQSNDSNQEINYDSSEPFPSDVSTEQNEIKNSNTDYNFDIESSKSTWANILTTKRILISFGIILFFVLGYYILIPSHDAGLTSNGPSFSDSSNIDSSSSMVMPGNDTTSKVNSKSEELKDTKIGAINQESIKDEGIVAAPVSDAQKGVSKAPKNDVEDYDKTFTKVEIESAYPGGSSAWMRYLNKTFRYPQEAQDNEIQGTVVVQFIVDKEGNVNDVEAVSGPTTGGLRDEAIRVIKKSGKWEPAVQNGRKVSSYKKQPLTFKLEDDIIPSVDEMLKHVLDSSLRSNNIRGVTIQIRENTITLSGEVYRVDLMKIMKTVNSVHPKRIVNNLLIK